MFDLIQNLGVNMVQYGQGDRVHVMSVGSRVLKLKNMSVWSSKSKAMCRLPGNGCSPDQCPSGRHMIPTVEMVSRSQVLVHAVGWNRWHAGHPQCQAGAACRQMPTQ